MSNQHQYSPYDPQRVERLKRILEKQSTPIYYEIYVDELLAVQRTQNIEDFDLYTEFITDTSRRIDVRFYVKNSYHYDTYSYYLQARTQEEAQLLAEQDRQARLNIKANSLNGITASSLDDVVNKRVDERMKEQELSQLRQQVSEKDDKLRQAEEFIGILEQKLEDFMQKGKSTSVITETATALAGILGVVNKQAPAPEGLAGDGQNSEVSFSKYTEENPPSAFMQQVLPFMQKIEAELSEEELLEFTQVIFLIYTRRDEIKTIKSLLINQ